MYSLYRVATRHLIKQADFEGASLSELIAAGRVLAKLVPTMDPKSVAYGTYVAAAFKDKQAWIKDLQKSLLLTYRKNLIEWMEHALVKRANLGGGGVGIKRVEKGLAAFTEAIPDILLENAPANLSDYLPDTEYFVSERLDPVGRKILSVVRKDAQKANIRVARQSHRFTVKWDARDRVWYIPFDRHTYNFYDQLAMDGFRANRSKRRWEFTKESIPPQIARKYDIEAGQEAKPVDANRLKDWYFEVWLPANIDRFTQVFSKFARSQQSSYATIFSVQGRKVKVKFKRDVDTPAKAVEELRYRYTNRRGREPWLEAIDYFIKLVSHTTPDKTMMLLIDRINNLNHSNGLFMEHFPSNIKSWYEGFLNAKFHAPTAGELAKHIPDRDLRNLFLEFTHYLYEDGPARLPGYQQSGPAQDYRRMQKDMPPGENWRAKGYPFAPGTGQVSRDSYQVQKDLARLRVFQDERDIWTITDPEVLHRLQNWLPKVKGWRGMAQWPDRNWVSHYRQVMERNKIDEAKIREVLSPIEAWVKEFRALMQQEPPIPKEQKDLPRYQKWMAQVQDKLDQKRKVVEAPMRKLLDEAKQQYDQWFRGMEDYWRETRLARSTMAKLLNS